MELGYELQLATALGTASLTSLPGVVSATRDLLHASLCGWLVSPHELLMPWVPGAGLDRGVSRPLRPCGQLRVQLMQAVECDALDGGEEGALASPMVRAEIWLECGVAYEQTNQTSFQHKTHVTRTRVAHTASPLFLHECWHLVQDAASARERDAVLVVRLTQEDDSELGPSSSPFRVPLFAARTL